MVEPEFQDQEEINEEDKQNTTIFAVRTTIGREKSVLDKIFQRLLVIKPFPDVKAMVMVEELRGYIFIEARFKRDVMILISGIPHVKGKILGSISLDSIFGLIKPRKVQDIFEEGDIVKIVSGVFEGRRAEVLRMPRDKIKQEVTLRLLDSDSNINIKMHGDYLKLIEKGEKHKEKYYLKDIEKIGEGAQETQKETTTEEGGVQAPAQLQGGLAESAAASEDTDEVFSFEEEYEEEFEEEYTPEPEEEEEEEEEDEWSKFEL